MKAKGHVVTGTLALDDGRATTKASDEGGTLTVGAPLWTRFSIRSHGDKA